MRPFFQRLQSRAELLEKALEKALATELVRQIRPPHTRHDNAPGRGELDSEATQGRIAIERDYWVGRWKIGISDLTKGGSVSGLQ